MNFQLAFFNYAIKVDKDKKVSIEYLNYLKSKNRRFDYLDEVFNPYLTTNMELFTGIDEEINEMNKNIDEVIEFYFKKQKTNNPKFSWEK